MADGIQRQWRDKSARRGGTKVLGKSKVPGESNEKSNRGSHEGPDRCEASPPKHECEHLSARSETPFCVTAVCVCVATPGRGAVLIASMPAGAAPGPGGKSFLYSIQVTAFAGRSVDRRVPRDPTRPVKPRVYGKTKSKHVTRYGQYQFNTVHAFGRTKS